MKLFNTLSRKKEEFVPIEPGKVGLYACGPTVYNYFHVGNARPFIVFDVLRRYLAHAGYRVTFVQNFTDIDDKMIRRANEEGISVAELARRFIAEYYVDAQSLGIARADVHPLATEHMAEIVNIIERLMEKGIAYVSSDGVYYDTQAFAGYGKLSGQNLTELEAGARVEVDENKRNPMDFALWKLQKPGEPAWPSPWGEGRPGWHIECSAMSMKYLGETFDIHCGGVDLMFPHHENEIAQSEGATGKPLANYWLHNGFINIDNQKMSKSAGNFFTVRDIAKQFDLEAVRLFLLSAHYRSPINFGPELVEQAKNALERLYIFRDHLAFLAQSATGATGAAGAAGATGATVSPDFAATCAQAVARFEQAMDDDLNTADALGALFEFVKDANIALTATPARADVEAAQRALTTMTGILGLLTRGAGGADEAVLALVEARQAARKAKNFAEADRLRAEIAAAGYILEDTPQGPKVRKA